MSQAKGSPAPSRLPTGASTTTSSTSRPNTNATAPLLPPILEPHYYYTTTAPAASSSLMSGSNAVGQLEEPRASGVRKTTSQIQSRLGFFSAPDEPRSVGSHGYLSPSYTDLRPAGPPRQVPSHKTATTGTSVSGLRPLRNGTSLLSEKDMQFLKERDADNQQVFDVWSQRKHLELQMEREELDRRKAESQARFEAREQQITDANNTAVKHWEQRKVKQQKADAEDSYLKQIKLRALQAYHDRINHAYDAKCKRREEGFAVRSGVAHIPQSFDAFRAQQRASKKAAAANPHQPVGKDRMSASYRSLLEEADREGDQEAALITMMGGTHPLVAIARQKSGDMPSSPAAGAGVSLEPSFASAARQGSSGNLLPPLHHHHLVSPTVLAQYLSPSVQACKASEAGELGAERSAAGGAAGARRSGDEDGDYEYAYDDDGEGSADGEPPQGILPPNITSIYAPREVIGAIVQQELDQAQDEFGHRLKAMAEDSMRRMEVAYHPVTPSSAAAVAPSEMDQTAAESSDTAAMLRVSPAFFAAYGGTGSGDGATLGGDGAAAAAAGGSGRSSPTPSASEQQYSDERFSSAGASQQDSVVYSRSASGSGLGPLVPLPQSSAASLSRRESSGSRASTSGLAVVTAAAAAVPGSASGRRESGEVSPAASESVVSEAVSDVASESRLGRRESAVSRITSISATAPVSAADGPLEALPPSRRESGVSRASSAASTGPAATASVSGGRASRRESSVAKAASGISLPVVDEDVPSAAPSRQESELNRAATAVPSRPESAASGAAVSGAGPSRRESERSRAATDAAGPSRRDSAASGAAVSGAAPARRESAASSAATEGPAPGPSTARAGGTSREGSRPSTSGTAPVKDAILQDPPSRRESGPVLSVSGSSEVPAFDPAPAANTSRPASSASGLSVPRSESVVDVGATGSGGVSGGFSASESGRRSSSPVGVEPSLALLPLTPVAPRGAGTNGAGRGTGSGDSDEDEEEEEEEEDEPQNETMEAPEKSEAEEETEEEDDDGQSSEEASQSDEETEAEDEEGEEEEEEEEDEKEEEEAGLSSEVDPPKMV